MNDQPGMDDLPVLTEVVGEDNDTLPVLTEAIEEAPPPAATDNAETFAAPDDESALQARLEQLFTEKLAARLAAAQQAVLAEALAELKADLPELMRNAQTSRRA